MYLKDQNPIEQVSDWSMPAAYIKLFLQHATAQGLLVPPLLSGTGLEADKLLQSDLPVTFQQTRKVLANANRIIGPGWHLALGRHLTVASHGPLGFAAVGVAEKIVHRVVDGELNILLVEVHVGPAIGDGGELLGREPNEGLKLDPRIIGIAIDEKRSVGDRLQALADGN